MEKVPAVHLVESVLQAKFTQREEESSAYWQLNRIPNSCPQLISLPLLELWQQILILQIWMASRKWGFVRKHAVVIKIWRVIISYGFYLYANFTIATISRHSKIRKYQFWWFFFQSSLLLLQKLGRQDLFLHFPSSFVSPFTSQMPSRCVRKTSHLISQDV